MYRSYDLRCDRLRCRDASGDLSFTWLHHVAIDLHEIRKSLQNFNSTLVLVARKIIVHWVTVK